MYLSSAKYSVHQLGVVPTQCWQTQTDITKDHPLDRAGWGKVGHPDTTGGQLPPWHQDSLASQSKRGGGYQQWTVELLSVHIRLILSWYRLLTLHYPNISCLQTMTIHSKYSIHLHKTEDMTLSIIEINLSGREKRGWEFRNIILFAWEKAGD